MRSRILAALIITLSLLLLPFAVRTEQAPPAKGPVTMRLNGTIRAIRAFTIQVPRVQGQGGNLTLIKLIDNGASVRSGDSLAEFDATTELKALRDAQAKFDDLSHQVEQKAAEQKSSEEKRALLLTQAEADLRRAEIEVKKDPIASEIDRQKNAIRLTEAKRSIASLNRSDEFHRQAEAAELRILELQRDRQKIAMQRAQSNVAKLTLAAQFAGMVAHENVFRGNSMGHAQVGDQLWPGSPLLQLFDPTEMEVDLSVNEADGAVLKPGLTGVVHLDAYPDARFTARYDSASPVAAPPGESPIRAFTARFRLDQKDPRLLPDLAAAIDIQVTP
jgi:HlyD family secretion protein